MAAKEFQCRLIERKALTPTVFQLTFDPGEKVDFRPGQFISVVIPEVGPQKRDVRRAYSIASPPEADLLEVCVKIVKDGPGTNYLNEIKTGAVVRVFAPYGSFVYQAKPGRDLTFIATGTGISPFRSMIFSNEFKNSPPREARLLWGAPGESELLYNQQMSAQTGVKWLPCLTRPTDAWTGAKGRVTDYLRKHLHEWRVLEADYYLCGNGAMIEEVKIILKEAGVEKTSIQQEIYYKPKNY